MAKTVPPQLGLASFSCPHCGTLTHQTWYQIYLEACEKGKAIKASVYEETWLKHAQAIQDVPTRQRAVNFVKRLEKNAVTYEVLESRRYLNIELVNAWNSKCFTCGAFTFWVLDEIVYPIKNAEIVAQENMPTDVRDVFDEAASIVDRSARGAAALLRLAIQKLMPHLDQPGKNLNADIAALVQKGLGTDLAKAMDVLRVVGNNAVHPGLHPVRLTPA
jgi:hypothetical protein